jgi:signal transduction histidine kinase
MPEPDPQIPAAPELGWALSRTLRTPLDGLRASLESLAAGLRQAKVDPAGAARAIDAVLEQLQRTARDVDALIAYAKPPAVAPLWCSIDEILHATLSALPVALRPRVRITCSSPGSSLWVDGPLLASALTRLLEASLSAPGGDNWVLLEVRHGESEVQFRVFDGGVGSILAPRVEREDSPQGAHLGLAGSLAYRDLERMGASLSLETLDGVGHLAVHVPVARARKGRAGKEHAA